MCSVGGEGQFLSLRLESSIANAKSTAVRPFALGEFQFILHVVQHMSDAVKSDGAVQ